MRAMTNSQNKALVVSSTARQKYGAGFHDPTLAIRPCTRCFGANQVKLYWLLLYDDQGQLLTGSLMDYLVPGAYESPKIQIVHMSTPSPWNDGGFKGVGESGIIGAPAAITNAVLDALQVYPAHIQLPLTPERILGWLQQRVGADQIRD